MAPSALPAPTTVCNSSMKRMIWPSARDYFLEDGFQTLFELTAELGSGDQRAHVERHDLFVLQAFGDVAADDALRQTFHDRRFADAGLTDQHRVVFCAAGENLYDTSDLLIASDNRIEFALGGELGQVAAVAFESFVGGFGILRCDALAAADFLERLHEAFASKALLLEYPAGRTLVASHGDQHVFDGDEVIFEALGFVFGFREQAVQATGDVDLIGRAGWGCDFRKAVELLFHSAVDLIWSHAGFQQQ